MAVDSPCKLRIGREQYQGTARLDAEHIDFAGQTKFRFRFSEMKNAAKSGGVLSFEFHGNSVKMDIGERSGKWLESILHPKSASEKLGVRPGQTVRFINFEDARLREQVEGKGGRVTTHDGKSPCHFIVMGAETATELRQLGSVASDLDPRCTVWVMLPRVSKAVNGASVTAAARQAGLAETRTVAYSDAFTAYRLVLPPEKRAAKPAAAAPPPGRSLKQRREPLRTASAAAGAPRRATPRAPAGR